MGADELPDITPKPAKRLHDDPAALQAALEGSSKDPAPDSLAIGGGKAGNELAAECAAVLAEHLAGSSCPLRALQVFGGFADGCAPALEALARNTSLRSLKLCGGIQEAAGAALAEALKENSGLEILQLYGALQAQDDKPFPTSIGEATGAALADALRVNTTLTTLQLGCGISVEGVKHILRALVENDTVTTLGFYSGGFSDEVAEELANVLEKSETLTKLELSGDISYQAANKLCPVLWENIVLEELQLGARVSSPGAFRLLMVWNGRGMKHKLLQDNFPEKEEDPLSNATGYLYDQYPSTTVMRTFVFQGRPQARIKVGRLGAPGPRLVA